jgi:NAD(P)-dependent dehydrogenase (short-subunit alcohol dehydrogenase family)
VAHWTADDIPPLAGRRAVVTGANSGLGFEAALELARHGADVTMLARDPVRGRAAVDRVRREVADAQAALVVVDLADLSSVRSFASTWLARGAPIDILVNNAGVMALPRERTVDGFERQFATNHLGHFALTGLLLPALRLRPGARVITVSSAVAQFGRIDFDDLQGERRYWRWEAYAQSKLANLLFAFELDRRAAASASPLVSVAAHPGFAATNLQAASPQRQGHRWRASAVTLGARLLGQSAAAGALPVLYGATAPDVHGGDYYGPGGPSSMRGHPTLVAPPHRALDAETATRLWAVSERLTGVAIDAV